MILVTLGTQKFAMNRLVEAMDKLAAKLKGEEVFIQTGNSTFKPVNCQYSQFVDSSEFKKMIEECSLLITHAGVGSIMTGINAGKPVIVVPRLKKYGEHVDDHQTQIAKAFCDKGCVICCEDVSQLRECIDKAQNGYTFKPYTAPDRKIEDIILDFMKKL